MAEAKTAKRPQAPMTPAPIALRLEGGYIVAKCGASFTVYELVWTSRHSENKRVLMLRECVEIPRQFESEAYGRQNGKAR